MRQGTTPTHTFTLPFALTQNHSVRIIYKQGQKVLFVKTNPDIEIAGSKISTRLSQKDTFLFDPMQKAKIQVRVLTPGGDALVSDVIAASVEECLEREVMR